MIDITLPGYYYNHVESFSAANTTKGKILVDTSPPQVVPVVTGTPGSDETTLPGEAAVRQRVLTGSRRVVDGVITSTDGTDRAVLFYQGVLLSAVTAIHALYGGMGTVTTTATTNSTITRSAGSFLTDGWKVGDAGMVFGSITASAANDGSLFIVTAVVAGTLTLSGTTGISVAGTEGAGYRIFKVGQVSRRKVPANSGNTDTQANVPIFGGAVDQRTDSSGIFLADEGILVAAMQAAVSALPAIVSVHAHSGAY